MTTTMRAAARGRRSAVQAVGGVLVVELLVFGVSTVPGVRAHPDFDPLLDGWLQGGTYVTIALLAALRPLRRPSARVIWTLVAVALGLRALGFVLYLGFVRELRPPPYPSIADVCWLAMPFMLLGCAVLFARRRFEHVATSMALDGVVGALACAAIAVTLLRETLLDLTRAGTPNTALVTNLLYPLTDLLLLIVILGLLTAAEWRPPPVLVLVSLGVAGFAIVDSVFLYESTAGTYRPGTPLASLSLLATALIAAAAWVPPQPVAERRRGSSLPGLVLPVVFALACLGVLVVAAVHTVPLGAVVLATLGLVVALARTLLSFAEVRGLSRTLRLQTARTLEGERAARAEAERLGAVLDGVEDYAIVGARAGRCTFFSPGAERMLGYRAEEVVGDHGLELFHLHAELVARAAELGTRPGVEAALAVARREGKETRSWTYVRKDGSHLPVEVTVAAVRDSPEEFVCVARDISDELRLESYRVTLERLAAELARMTRPDPQLLRSILRIVTEGMGWDLGHVWLAEGDTLRCVSTWHHPTLPGGDELERYVLQSQIRRGEGLAGRVWETGAVEWVADIQDAEMHLTESQREVREGAGRAVHAAVSLPVIGADGEAALGVLQLFARRPRPPEPELLALLESVASTFGRQLERVRTAQELRFARDEAEAADRAKTELVSRISHELRTPLNAILGFAQLLDRGELTERQHEQTEQIASGGRHLVAVIDDLIDLSRIETGELRVSLESVDVTAVLREVIDLTRPLVDERGLELEVDAHGGLFAHVLADYQRLRQVLLNLLSNAVKYNRPGGRIRIFFEDPGDGRLRFAVRDTGAGIAQRDLPLLFQAFERLGAEAGAEQGTGLGLVVSRGLVEAMGGRLLVASEVGVGTTFRIELARASAPATARPTPPEPGWWPGGEHADATILYIEDNPANVHLVRDIVAGRPGLELLATPRGSAGLELARTHRPDLVLLDMNLPDVSGEDVLAALKSGPATSTIPVLVLSADATPERRRALLEQGAAGYLAKPLDVGEFVAAVQPLLPG